jgi:hypothetical protein
LTTANDLFTRSARALGYLGRGEVLSAGDANDILNIFNSMLDSWSNENLLSYVVLERSFALQVGVASYTIGSGGVINATRPLDITMAYVRDTGSNNFIMRIQPRDKWNEIGNRGSTITSQIPTDLFYDPQYPLGVINIFPTPLIAYTVFYDSTQQQVDPTALSSTISMPEGYDRAYYLNLALEMAANGFPVMLDDKQYTQLVNNASQAKANVKRTNIKDVISNYDPQIVSRSYATYNIFSDGRTGDT